MFNKVLIANRGVIACRIQRTLRRLGVKTVAVYSEADRHAPHVMEADEAVLLGPAPAAQSYLLADKVIEAALATGAEAIHPGYGFLSENAGFAEGCQRVGIAFIGPTPEQMRKFGLKHTSREIARGLGVPLLEGTGVLASVEEALTAAAQIGYPVMLKSSAGGGGIGMKLCATAEELEAAYESVKRMSEASFGDAALFLERAVMRARHIEVQIFGDGKGRVLTLGERDCSAQRRNQKVMEETPAPGIGETVRKRLFEAARKLGEAVHYRSAGTVEFLYDAMREDFYFLEVNTRLQVEHGVTEEVTGVDLVEWMVRLAAGEAMADAAPEARGHSIQARLYAEDPYKDFAPSAGRVTQAEFPAEARVETWIAAGAEVSPYYDPMLAKIIVHGATRKEAVRKMGAALDATRVSGIETNLSFLRQLAGETEFVAGGIDTSFLRSIAYRPQAIDVLEPGTQTSVQDYPGRLGYWHVGVPPSGPMDGLSLRMANRMVGNAESAAALEIAMTGPTLRFRSSSVIALAGADFGATLGGVSVAPYEPIAVPAGATLALGRPPIEGARAYLAVRGGIEAPVNLGSRSTFILGGFGGPLGRALRAGDVLHLGTAAEHEPKAAVHQPKLSNEWKLGVMCGPHGAPDYFTPEDIDTFFTSEWTVHYNSDRTGVRLMGPKPKWARKDGGEAGLHPSNIHDNAYAIGTVDFTGDMPVILGPDGPSLGGFVCPATIVTAELWKIGQLRAGDKVRFHPLTLEEAAQMEVALDVAVEGLEAPLPGLPKPTREPEVITKAPGIVCRADGDRNLLIEYGPNVLDLNLRFRVHALERRLRGDGLPGILDITPGIRSLQIHYDGRRLRRETLLEAVAEADGELKDLADIEVPSRTVHLPLSWDDPATRLAIQKYMQSVRPDAPWCPSNIEFIRRINGLASIDDVYRTVFDASYLVMGLGDVYLGAPVATPVDPRHRLVTTKYNPARTWTPENAVGIGGAYLCVYGMEGPGGYQFVGRTVQMWNTWRATKDFPPGSPWLLRFFDQIRFYPVSSDELLEMRDGFPHGKFALKVEETRFSLAAYNKFLKEIGPSAWAFKQHQQAAFEAERGRWMANGQADFVAPEAPRTANAGEAAPPGCQPVRAPVTANVWSIAVETGQRVEAGERLVVLEAMKMEVAVAAPSAGVVELLHCSVGNMVMGGQQLLHIRVDA